MRAAAGWFCCPEETAFPAAKASGGKRNPRRENHLLAQPRSDGKRLRLRRENRLLAQPRPVARVTAHTFLCHRKLRPL